MASMDGTVTDHGTVWTFDLTSGPARAWVEENVNLPDYMGTPGNFAADWRQGYLIYEALVAEGYDLELQGRPIGGPQ